MKLFIKRDLFLILSLLIFAFSMYLCFVKSKKPDTGLVANIYMNDEIVKTIELNYSDDILLRMDKFESLDKMSVIPDMIFFVKSDNRIRIVYSDCPDKICVGTGFLTYEGNAAFCIPNKVVLKIENKE